MNRLFLALGLLLTLHAQAQWQLPIKLKKRKPVEKTATVSIQANEVKITPTRSDDFRTTPDKIIDIVHMDLALRFDFQKHTCTGKQDLLLTAYNYPTDTIVLDAKNMIFNGVELKTRAGDPVTHLIQYNKRQLRIQFEKPIKPGDTLWLSLQYTAQPDMIEPGGSKAIRDNKGLYFMNTEGKEPFKPMQVWTQGETESNSNWFPFIDKPHEKFTQTLYLTVPDSLTTLSNGLLTRSDTVDGGYRTDVWENDLPMSGYLVMMAIGNFKVFNDSLWREKPVDYYLEPNYAPYATEIFKHTSAMLEFFSNQLGVLYPWQKYAQVVVRDFVSGAMENTSATLHGDFVQKNPRELVDGGNDGIIAHELFHQWFGDLITCESWSHLVVNEGFAAYGEQLWYEHQYGQEAGLRQAYNSMERYLNYAKRNADVPIVDFNYKDKEDMFSAITYQKGARILHLLRNELGDETFFLSLKTFLIEHAFQAVQIDDLRRSFEKVSGRDLRPFFNQWFLKGGHPVLDVHYTYLDSANLLQINIEQKQEESVGLYHFPLQFHVRQGNKTQTYTFNIAKKNEVFFVKKLNPENPERVNVSIDPLGIFPGEMIEHKPIVSWILLAKRGNYIERVRAYKAMKEGYKTDTIYQTLLAGLDDSDDDIRARLMDWIPWQDSAFTAIQYPRLVNYMLQDRSPQVRAKAIKAIHKNRDPRFNEILKKATNDSSYTVAGNALLALLQRQPNEAYTLAHRYENDARGTLLESISKTYAQQGATRDLPFFYNNLMLCFKNRRAVLLEDLVSLGLRVNNANQEQTMISILTQRAEMDESPVVRQTAIIQLHRLRQEYMKKMNLTSDINEKNNQAQAADKLQATISRLVQQETNKDVLNQLKINGIQ